MTAPQTPEEKEAKAEAKAAAKALAEIAATQEAHGAVEFPDTPEAPTFPHPENVDVAGASVIIGHEDGRRYEVSRGAFEALYKPEGFTLITAGPEETEE